MRQCPRGSHWNEKIQDCIQDVAVVKSGGGSHFFRNVGLFLIGLAFGYFSLWSFGMIFIVAFLLLLAVLFFMDSRPVIYPIVGFVIGFILIYWSQISGILKWLGGIAGGG